MIDAQANPQLIRFLRREKSFQSEDKSLTKEPLNSADLISKINTALRNNPKNDKTKFAIFQEIRESLDDYERIVSTEEIAEGDTFFLCICEILKKLLYFPEYVDVEKINSVLKQIELYNEDLKKYKKIQDKYRIYSNVGKKTVVLGEMAKIIRPMMHNKTFDSFFRGELRDIFCRDLIITNSKGLTKDQREKIRRNLESIYKKRDKKNAGVFFERLQRYYQNYNDDVISEGRIGNVDYILKYDIYNSREKIEIYTADGVYEFDLNNPEQISYLNTYYDERKKAYRLEVTMPKHKSGKYKVWLYKPNGEIEHYSSLLFPDTQSNHEEITKRAILHNIKGVIPREILEILRTIKPDVADKIDSYNVDYQIPEDLEDQKNGKLNNDSNTNLDCSYNGIVNDSTENDNDKSNKKESDMTDTPDKPFASRIKISNRVLNEKKYNAFQQIRILLIKYNELVKHDYSDRGGDLFDYIRRISEYIRFFPELEECSKIRGFSEIIKEYNTVYQQFLATYKSINSPNIFNGEESQTLRDKKRVDLTNEEKEDNNRLAQKLYANEMMTKLIKIAIKEVAPDIERLNEYFGTNIEIEELTPKERKSSIREIKKFIKNMNLLARKNIELYELVNSEDVDYSRVRNCKIGKDKYVLVTGKNNNPAERVEIYTAEKIYVFDASDPNYLKFTQIDHKYGIGCEELLFINMPLQPGRKERVVLSKLNRLEECENESVSLTAGNRNNFKIIDSNGNEYEFYAREEIFQSKPQEIVKNLKTYYYNSDSNSYIDEYGKRLFFVKPMHKLDEENTVPGVTNNILGLTYGNILELYRTVNPEMAFLVQEYGENPTLAFKMINKGQIIKRPDDTDFDDSDNQGRVKELSSTKGIEKKISHVERIRRVQEEMKKQREKGANFELDKIRRPGGEEVVD